MSRNLCRTNCRTCEGKVVITGVLYKGDDTQYQQGIWLADAECVDCKSKYTAWVGPSHDTYGWRTIDRQLVAEHGFYDLSYRSTFNDEPGEDDVPKTKVQIFRVVKIGEREIWHPLD